MVANQIILMLSIMISIRYDLEFQFPPMQCKANHQIEGSIHRNTSAGDNSDFK